MCISPFSVAALLSMVHAGAKGNTAKQLKEALGLGKFSDQKIHATIGDMVKSTEVLIISNKCINFFLNKDLLNDFIG